MITGFDWSILGAPLLAGMIVVSTHVVFGREVLRRGIIFIDLTIAQVAAVGVILAEMLELGAQQGWQVQAAAGLAALTAASLLAWTERNWPLRQEALIGSLYVVAACAAILLLANNPHGHEHLAELLAGQILWVNHAQLLPLAVSSALILLAWFFGHRWRSRMFYFLFAIAVMASVQVVGVFLVFASLILPALACAGLPDRRGLVIGWVIGLGGYALGLWLSVPLDLPAGPLIVCLLATLALLFTGLRRLT